MRILLFIKKRILLCLLLVAQVFSSYGQIFNFTNNVYVNYTSRVSQSQVCILDVDQDTDLDLITWGGYNMYLFKNLDGNGQMSNAQYLYQSNSYTSRPIALCYADIDNDDDNDLILTYYHGGKNQLGIRINTDGQGEFGTLQPIDTTDYPMNFVETAFLNSDSLPDIVFSTAENTSGAESKRGKIAYKFNLGGGVFSDQHDIVIADHMSGFAIGDIDLDSDMDLFYAVYDSSVYVIENNESDSIYGNSHAIYNSGGVTAIAVGDIDDENSKAEIFIGSNSKDYLTYLRYSTSLDSYNATSIARDLDELSDIEIDDIDSDGKPEVFASFVGYAVSYEYDQNTNKFYTGNISGNSFYNGYTDNVFNLEVGDITGDGNKDLVFSSSYTAYTIVSKDSSISSQKLVFGNSAQLLLSQPVFNICDFDNDGDYDVLNLFKTITSPGYYLRVNENERVNFIQGNSTYKNVVDFNTRGIYSGDMNGDSLSDIIIAGSGGVYWIKNTGTDSIGTVKIITTYSSEVSEVIDFDLDGDLDVVAMHSQGFAWYENYNGEGDFAEGKLIAGNLQLLSDFEVADIDNDSYYDIVFMSGNDLEWLQYPGANSSYNLKTIEENINSYTLDGYKIEVKDIDADGDQDIFVNPKKSPEAILLYENKLMYGNISFERRKITEDVTQTFDVADIDLDGDYDIAASINPSNEMDYLVYYEKLDSSDFSYESKGLIDLGLFNNIQLIDIDNDGDKDLFCSNILKSGAGYWHENNLIDTNSFPRIGKNMPALYAKKGDYFQYNIPELVFYDTLPFEVSLRPTFNDSIPNWLHLDKSLNRVYGTIPNDYGPDSITFVLTAVNSDDQEISDSTTLHLCGEAHSLFSYEQVGDSIQFISDMAPNVSKIWYYGDGNTDQHNNPKHSYTAFGRYNVTLISYNECDIDTTVKTITYNGLASILPTTGYYGQQMNTMIHGGLYSDSTLPDVTLKNNTGQYINAQVSLSDSNHVMALFDFKAAPPGIYDLLVSNINYTDSILGAYEIITLPGDTISNYRYVSLSAKEENCVVLGTEETIIDDIKIYPNPANTILNLELNKSDDYKTYTIRVYNIHGIMVYTETSQNNLLQINVNKFKKGMYILEVTLTDNISQHQFIIQ